MAATQYIVEIENQGDRWFWTVYQGSDRVTCQPYCGTKDYAIRRALHDVPAGASYAVYQKGKQIAAGLNYSDPEGSIQ